MKEEKIIVAEETIAISGIKETIRNFRTIETATIEMTAMTEAAVEAVVIKSSKSASNKFLAGGENSAGFFYPI